MVAHGDFSVIVEGNIVHTYPVGGFNKEGIESIRAAIVDAIPNTNNWILFEHPKDQAGLTPDAAQAIGESYLEFEKQGCQEIRLEVCSTWRAIITRQLSSKLDIPLTFI
ncbi:hypothetical protein ACFSJY_16875 [Thalassotalea euphylliae]|uniref:hypothetical protein n=1 Tax=Thalassotalea euphylliae TaxID=1655234 RepID=UPI00363152E8